MWNRALRGPAEQARQGGHEGARVRLPEMPLKRLVVRPLLHEHVALVLLEVAVHAVAEAPVLLPRALTHLRGDLEKTLAVLLGYLHAAGDDDHAGHAICTAPEPFRRRTAHAVPRPGRRHAVLRPCPRCAPVRPRPRCRAN